MSYNSCYCDYDPATVHRVSLHKTRKPRICIECHAPIYVGEEYEYTPAGIPSFSVRMGGVAS